MDQTDNNEDLMQESDSSTSTNQVNEISNYNQSSVADSNSQNLSFSSKVKKTAIEEGLPAAANAYAPGTGVLVKSFINTPEGQKAVNKIVSNKRANSMNPLSVARGAIEVEKEEQEAQEIQDIMENDNLNDETKKDSNQTVVNSKSEKSSNTKAIASKKIINFLKKHPYVLAIAGVFLIIIILFIMILVVIIFMTSDSGSDNSSSGAGSASFGNATTTESCQQLKGQSLSDALQSKNSSIDKFNEEAQNAIDDAGFGSRAGVVAAALSITSDLCSNYSIRLPYEWGGGHGQINELANGNWGSSKTPDYENGRSYLYLGLDCSGYVSWAIYNGGYKFSSLLADDFPSLGPTHSMKSDNFVGKPGDLIHHSGHIMMIVGVDESAKTYKVAEAANGDDGIRVVNMNFDGGSRSNSIIDMSDFYADSSKKRTDKPTVNVDDSSSTTENEESQS